MAIVQPTSFPTQALVSGTTGTANLSRESVGTVNGQTIYQGGDGNYYTTYRQPFTGQTVAQPLSQSQLSNFFAQQATPAAAPAAAAGTTKSPFGQNPTFGWMDGTGAGGAGGGTTTMANAGLQPEQVALQQMAQIDPASEALRQQLAASYASPLAAAGNVPMPVTPTMGPPSAAALQSYLNAYGQIDPTGLAATQQLETALSQQAALGSQLDPVTQMQVEQATREAQLARGNVYGTPQLVQEAMTTGQAGLALQQQRQQALQSYLTSGAAPGVLANQLYQQGLANYQNQYNQYLNAWNAGQGNLRAAQAGAMGYLGSGITPYQAGANYVSNANQMAALAAQGGPVYQPQGPSSYYTGAGTSSFPQYGLDISQIGNQYMQAMNYGQYQQAALNQPRGGGAGGAAGGALQGAASGALTGAATGPWGALIGAGVGALGGAAKGYFG